MIADFVVSGSVLVEEACRLVANTCEPLRYGAVTAVAEDLADVGEGGDSAAQDDHHFAVAGVEQGQEVAAGELVYDFDLLAVDRGGVVEFDEGDADLGALVVERPLEVLLGV